MNLALSKLNMSGGTQSRAELNLAAVREYAESMRGGAEFPPVTVFFDGKTHWLADGFHRAEAARAIGRTEIAADVRQGDRRAAILHSVGTNGVHGLRRSNEDKRRAVQTLLEDPEWSKWSDREIAKTAAVSHEFVRGMRPQVSTVDTSTPNRPISQKRTGADGKSYPAKQAPRSPEPEPAPVDPEPAEEEPAPVVAPKPGSIVRDSLGQIVDPTIAPAFTVIARRANAVARVLKSALVEWKGIEDELADCDGERAASARHFGFLRNEIEKIKPLAGAIAAGAPHALCPYCKGHGACDGCQGAGWVTESVYDSAPPELRKAAR